jgi:hypothetical protein
LADQGDGHAHRTNPIRRAVSAAVIGAAIYGMCPHTITVKAYDEQGNVGTRTVTVTK